MLKKLFGFNQKKVEEDFFAPLSGKIISLEEVPDPVFSQKMMGDGLAIIPSEGIVVSPVNGKIEHIFPTKHAIGIISETGAEILIHVGLETVAMNGEGFELFVNVGDRITVGTKLLAFDINLITEKSKSTITPFVITNDINLVTFEISQENPAQKGVTKLANIKVKQ